MKRQNLWLTVGIPGSGKSWFVKNEFDELTKSENTSIISRDAIRYNILDTFGGEYFDHEDEVFEDFVNAIKAAITTGEHKNIIADATHISPASRDKLLSQFNLTNVNVNFICFTTSFPTCMTRNDSREGRAHVPEDAMSNMYKKLEFPSEEEIEKYHTEQIIIVDEDKATLLNKRGGRLKWQYM